MKLFNVMVASLMFSFSNVCLANSNLASITSAISNSADNQLILAINQPLPFVVADWAILANYYSQNSTFPPVGIFAVDTSILTGVSSITNTAFGTLDVVYGPGAPGPLANNGYSLAPARVQLRGNLFYVYELVQCYTNITDSMTSAQAPQPGRPIGIFSNSNLGANCIYAANPSAAAIAAVQGTTTAPSQQGVGP